MVVDSVKYTLDKIVSTVGELPAAPAVVVTAMRLTANLESSTDNISQILSSDQSLTARVLRIANSPFYGRVKKVQSVDEAVLILGFKSIRSLIVASSAHSLYFIGNASGSQAKLWRHSLSTAIAARQIAERLQHPEMEETFISALMHDIGKLVLIQKLPEWYSRIVKEIEEKACSFREVEQRVFHFDHCDVASLLLTQWEFPMPLVRAIVRHHRPPSFRPGGAVPIAQIVHLANFMAKNLNVGFNDEKVEILSRLPSAQAMALNENVLGQIFEKFQDHYLEEIRIFENS